MIDSDAGESKLEEAVTPVMAEYLKQQITKRKRTTLFINKGQHKVYFKEAADKKVQVQSQLFVKATGNEATAENEVLEIESEVLSE